MKRCLHSAERKYNPRSTEKLDREFHSGDTLSDPDVYPWEVEHEQPRAGSVKEGVSMVEPMYDDQIKLDRRKRS